MSPLGSAKFERSWSPVNNNDDDDGESVAFLTARHKIRGLNRLAPRVKQAIPWTLHFILIFTYIVLASRFILKQSQSCFDDKLLDPPIVWENRHFRSSVDVVRDTVNDTVGSSGPMLGEDWESILDVGVIRISEEEIARIPAETAHLYGEEEGYAGILEVFHQLHCLNRLRSRFQQNHTISQQDIDHPHMAHAHNMHCFDYLWQTLLCHADVSVMSLEYNDEQQAFNANFDVIKQCRNFDVIHDWAKVREAKYKPPGSHKA